MDAKTHRPESTTPPGLLIRKATLEDLPTIVRFQLKMSWETEELRLHEETVLKGVEQVLGDPHKGSYWVAEDRESKRILGCLLTIPEWSDWRNGTVLWIHSVYVEEDARGRGVFKGLYLHLKNKVETDPHYKGLRLYVDRRNVRAQKVYESLGMNGDHYLLYEWMP